MIPCDKQCGEREPFQFVKLCVVPLVAKPNASEIAANDHIVFAVHFFLFRKNRQFKTLEICVAIAGCENHPISCSI